MAKIRKELSSQDAPPAVVLLSGGIDSSTALWIAKSEGFAVHALSFRYGQRHQVELEAAGRVAIHAEVMAHKVVDVGIGEFGGSALTDAIEIPKDRDVETMRESIPPTYVPARNSVFLAIAMAWCEVLRAENIFIGANVVDYSGYPDCRPEYFEAFERMANLATKAGVENTLTLKIRAPLIHSTKAEIVRQGTMLGADYSLTLSCYDPTRNGEACGHCDSCVIRRQGFLKAGIPDPTRYRSY